MNGLIDTNLDAGQPARKKRGLNAMLLAAYILIQFGDRFITSVYDDLFRDIKYTDYFLVLLNLVLILGAAFLSDTLRQTRLLNIIGASVLIFTCVITMVSDTLTGYPLAILFYGSSGLLTYPLLKRLVINTEFFGREQVTLYLSLAGTTIGATFFFQLLHQVETRYSDVVMTSFGAVLIGIGLVLLLVDREEDPVSSTSLQEYISNGQQNFWTHFALPFALIALVLPWISIQSSRAYYSSSYMEGGGEYRMIIAFATMVLSMGLLALLITVAKIKNHWVYIATGGGILVLLLALFISGTEVMAEKGWIFSILNAVGRSLCFFGISLWVYRYSHFPFLTLLLSLPYALDYIAYMVTNNLGLDLVEMLRPGE